MRRLVVLGAGTAGTMIVNKLRPLLSAEDWEITVVDPATSHLYQPGLLFVPFGRYEGEELRKPTSALLPEGVELVTEPVERVDVEVNQVQLASGRIIGYDQLVIATGTHTRPDMTPGMDGPALGDTVHEFYTLPGAEALRRKLELWDGGRFVVHITELPIKCPVAPLEFAFLADDYFKRAGMRDRVDMTFVTPLSGAFTKPIASDRLGDMLDTRGIRVEPDFYVERLEDHALVSFDERVIPFDLLVTVPLNMGADFVARSGLGDELNHVRVDPHTFLADGCQNVFALGDAAALPISKAGSVAHFAVDVFVENFIDHIAGNPMERSFDGHANCFVEAGGGKALLIDFNYETEPLPGTYPIPGVGPLSLLKETRMNHLGKLAFRPIYWHMLLQGRRLPVPSAMSMAGKEIPTGDQPREGRDHMTVAAIQGREIHVDPEGFLTDPMEWDEGLAETLAANIGIDLTEGHWAAIRFARSDYAANGETPTLRRMATAGGVPTKEMFDLFPKKPAKKMAYVAGLPKPVGCV